MNWLNELERRLGRFNIPNITIYIICGQIISTVLGLAHPDFVARLFLDPVALLQGEWWRAISFIFVPELDPASLIFAIFWFMFLWTVGQGLEQQWGAFKVNLYMATGVFFQVLGSLLLLRFFGLNILSGGQDWTLSLMLAFAYLYPEMEIYLFMILPVKMKWLAWIAGALLIFRVVTGGSVAFLIVCFSMANYLLFFGPEYWLHWRSVRSTASTRARMQESVRVAMTAAPSKRCQACGRGVQEADLRLCNCEKCGEDGKFWCTDDLKAHLRS